MLFWTVLLCISISWTDLCLDLTLSMLLVLIGLTPCPALHLAMLCSEFTLLLVLVVYNHAVMMLLTLLLAFPLIFSNCPLLCWLGFTLWDWYGCLVMLAVTLVCCLLVLLAGIKLRTDMYAAAWNIKPWTDMYAARDFKLWWIFWVNFFCELSWITICKQNWFPPMINLFTRFWGLAFKTWFPPTPNDESWQKEKFSDNFLYFLYVYNF